MSSQSSLSPRTTDQQWEIVSEIWTQCETQEGQVSGCSRSCENCSAQKNKELDSKTICAFIHFSDYHSSII